MGNSEEINFVFNGKKLKGMEGQPIAAALMAHGIRAIRNCEVTGEARGIYCGIGHCFECRATVNGVPSQRTCLILIEEGMVVTSGKKIHVGVESNEC